MNKVTKRHFTLMEVMISFILILFCMVPLIYPNMAIYKEQVKSNQKFELDHVITLLYGDLLEQIHKRIIPYEQITQKMFTPIPIGSESYINAGVNPSTFPYTGSLKARLVKRKGQKNGKYILNLVEFTYSFQRKHSEENPIEFTYIVPLVKLKAQSEEQAPEKPPKAPSTEEINK